MCVAVAAQHNEYLKSFYQRLRQNGKHPKSPSSPSPENSSIAFLNPSLELVNNIVAHPAFIAFALRASRVRASRLHPRRGADIVAFDLVELGAPLGMTAR